MLRYRPVRVMGYRGHVVTVWVLESSGACTGFWIAAWSGGVFFGSPYATSLPSMSMTRSACAHAGKVQYRVGYYIVIILTHIGSLRSALLSSHTLQNPQPFGRKTRHKRPAVQLS
jgi:hypothetical protein